MECGVKIGDSVTALITLPGNSRPMTVIGEITDIIATHEVVVVRQHNNRLITLGFDEIKPANPVYLQETHSSA